MKLAVFVNEFPVLSETFVINQIKVLLDLGVDVSIIAKTEGSLQAKQHQEFVSYQLENRTTYLSKEPAGPGAKLLYRMGKILVGFLQSPHRGIVFSSFNAKRYGRLTSNLSIPAIVASVNRPMKFDVMLCHFGVAGVLANYLRDLGVIEGKIATIFHGFDVTATKTLTYFKEDYQKLFQGTELILPISNLWASRLIAMGCPEDKIYVHRMGVDLTKIVFEPKPPSQEFRVFTAARFTEKKGLKYAIKAVAEVCKDTNLQYVIAGYGEQEPALKQLVQDLSLQDRVQFIGAVDQDEVLRQMKRSDAFLLPSVTAANGDMEGLPVSIMEAMAVGTPVISTNHSAIPELVTHGESGFLSEERNVGQLAENIRLCAKSPELRKTIALSARQAVEAKSDVVALNQELLRLLKSL